MEVAAEHLRYEVAVGDPLRSMALLTARTGRQQVPPGWAFDAIIGRRVVSRQTAGQYQAMIQSAFATIVADRLSVTGYRLPYRGLASAVRRPSA